MENIIVDEVGLIHFISSLFSLIFGTYILVAKKGTKMHSRIGYLYVFSMITLITTAFMIYRLFNGWGVFHYSNVISLVSISLGILPIWTKKPKYRWKYLHFTFMYWSVIGLYSAFSAELLTRIPKAPFYEMVGLSTLTIMIIGGIFYGINKNKWIDLFNSEE